MPLNRCLDVVQIAKRDETEWWNTVKAIHKCNFFHKQRSCSSVSRVFVNFIALSAGALFEVSLKKNGISRGLNLLLALNKTFKSSNKVVSFQRIFKYLFKKTQQSLFKSVFRVKKPGKRTCPGQIQKHVYALMFSDT